jgi:hypothetical protein
MCFVFLLSCLGGGLRKENEIQKPEKYDALDCGKRFFCSMLCVDTLRCPPNALYNGYPGCFRI